MASGIQPDAGQILNSLINSVLVVDDALAIHYANPAAQQLLAQSSRKLFGRPLPELLSYFSLNIDLMRESLAAGQGFTDNEVTLVIDSRSHILSLTAQRLPDDFILLEMAPMDNQRRLSQEQLQHAQQIAVRGLAHEIKNPLGGLRGAAQLLSKALPDPALTEYTKVIIEQADRLRNLVDRLLGPQHPGMHITESIHKVAERVVALVSMELPDNVRLIRDYDPSLPELPHDPEQIEQVLLNIVRNALQALGPDGGEITLRTRTAFQLTLHGERYRLAAQTLKTMGRAFLPIYRIRCSTRWSAVAKAAPGLGYLSPAILSINTPAKLNLPVGRGIPSFRFTCRFGNRGVYATRNSLGRR